jgi:hypothetical protein
MIDDVSLSASGVRTVRGMGVANDIESADEAAGVGSVTTSDDIIESIVAAADMAVMRSSARITTRLRREDTRETTDRKDD